MRGTSRGVVARTRFSRSAKVQPRAFPEFVADKALSEENWALLGERVRGIWDAARGDAQLWRCGDTIHDVSAVEFLPAKSCPRGSESTLVRRLILSELRLGCDRSGPGGERERSIPGGRDPSRESCTQTGLRRSEPAWWVGRPACAPEEPRVDVEEEIHPVEEIHPGRPRDPSGSHARRPDCVGASQHGGSVDRRARLKNPVSTLAAGDSLDAPGSLASHAAIGREKLVASSEPTRMGGQRPPSVQSLACCGLSGQTTSGSIGTFHRRRMKYVPSGNATLRSPAKNRSRHAA